MRRALACLIALIGTALLVQPSEATQYVNAYRGVTTYYTQPGGVTAGSGTAVLSPSTPVFRQTARSGEDRVTIAAKDDSTTDIALRISVTPKGSTTAKIYFACNHGTVPLPKGATVTAVPLDGRCADGRLSTARSGKISGTFHRLVPKPKPVVKGAPPALRWAVLVGIQHYAGGTEPTVGGVGDVLAIRKALISSGWQSNHILTLTDGAATQAAIRNAFGWLAAHSSAHTFSLFHYSGHVCIASRGPCASGHTYLWSYDNRFIPEAEVVSRMHPVRGPQWLDIAGCEAGAFDAGYHSTYRLFTGSSAASETSYEVPQWKESVWSGLTWDRGYNQGLADPYGRPMHATIAQMATYGVQQAAAYTSRQGPGPQHPVLHGGASTWSLAAPPGG